MNLSQATPTQIQTNPELITLELDLFPAEPDPEAPGTILANRLQIYLKSLTQKYG